MPKPRNWRQIQASRWNVYEDFEEIIDDFFERVLPRELGVSQHKLVHQKERLLIQLKKVAEIYHGYPLEVHHAETK